MEVNVNLSRDINRYFAAFMEVRKCVTNPEYDYINQTDTGALFIKASDLAYHKEWAWLMPVVERIEAMGYIVKIDTNYVTINHYNPVVQIFRGQVAGESKLQMVWRAVAMFLLKKYDLKGYDLSGKEVSNG